ncbi:MAG: cell division protein ZipA [Steroidobacteraceae bacterium]
MAAELRWILLALCVPLLAAIWWWTARRSGQSPGNPELRESTPPPDPRYADSGDENMRAQPKPREWGVPPFEPLNIRTAEFEPVPVLTGPILINADPAPHSDPDPAAAPITASAPAAAPAPAGPHTPTAEAADMPAAAHNAAGQQKIVTIRVCAVGESRWPGAQLMAALEQHGLAFGRYQVFHRRHADGRSLFCVASLIEPGTFDPAAMADQEFRGITLFAVMPGPTAPLETLDELVTTARGLAEELPGMVQDGRGMPFSPQRAAAVREDVARFQASLPVN